MSGISPKFLLVQYPEGAAGVFLISLLTASDSVGHYDPLIHSAKSNHSCLNYIQEKYTSDVSTWLLNEPRPQIPLNLHFISARFSRGDDLSNKQFYDLCKNDASKHFWNIAKSNKLIPMIWHKQVIPNFFNSPKIVTVILDETSHKWYHRALWYKKYGLQDGLIHIKADDPKYNPSRAEYFKIFNNPYLIKQHPYSFIKQHIVKTKFKEIFKSSDNFLHDNNRVFINLSEILDRQLLINAVDRICYQLGLNKISHDFISQAWKHWRSCHDTFMPKYS